MDNKPTDSPQPRPVMDIQPPQQPAPAPASAPEVVSAATPTVNAESAPVQDVTPPTEPAPAPTETTEPTETTQASAPETQPVPLAAQPAVHKHSRVPMVAIVVAVLLAGVLGTFAFMAYKDSSKQPATATTQTQPAPAVQEMVAPTEVDETNAAVDQSLNSVDDTADYNDASLSDTSLGL